MNPGFQETDILVRTGDGWHVVVMEEFTYVTKSGIVITVPIGVTSDGGSIPKVLWNILPPFGRYWKATVLHDYLYRYTQYDKQFCDYVFFEAMGFLGVDDHLRTAIFDGVDKFGQSAFDEDRLHPVRL